MRRHSTSKRNLYIVDRLNAVIRRVDGGTGLISTLAGTGVKGFAGDGGRPATQAQFREPNDCGSRRPRWSTGRGCKLIGGFAASILQHRDDRDVWRHGKTFGSRKSRSSGDGGPAVKAVLAAPVQFASTRWGASMPMVAGAKAIRIRKVDLSGVITTVAGTGMKRLLRRRRLSHFRRR